MSLGKYGQAFLDSLKESRPELYATLEAKGELQPTAEAVDERARVQFEHLLAQLRAQNPLPKDPVARVGALKALESQANELVMEEVLVKDEETESAMRDGYVDPEPKRSLRLNPPTSLTSPGSMSRN